MTYDVPERLNKKQMILWNKVYNEAHNILFAKGINSPLQQLDLANDLYNQSEGDYMKSCNISFQKPCDTHFIDKDTKL